MPEFSPDEIVNREHIAPDKTGDNIAAKKVALYVWNAGSSQWQRATASVTGSNANIFDSAGNSLDSTSGSLNVAITSGGLTQSAANDSFGTTTSLADGSTATLVNIPSTTSYKLAGFSVTGNGDGYFFVQVAGATIISARTRFSQPSILVALPNPVAVADASTVALKVTNESGSTANFEGTLFGV